MLDKIAVYGTLKKGGSNHYIIQEAKFLGTCRTEPKFTLWDLGCYPAVQPGGDTAVLVEVYEVNPEQFQQVDWLEGYPTLYNRTKIETEYGRAWIYYMEHVYSGLLVDSGVWNEEVGG